MHLQKCDNILFGAHDDCFCDYCLVWLLVMVITFKCSYHLVWLLFSVITLYGDYCYFLKINSKIKSLTIPSNS